MVNGISKWFLVRAEGVLLNSGGEKGVTFKRNRLSFFVITTKNVGVSGGVEGVASSHGYKRMGFNDDRGVYIKQWWGERRYL